MITVRTMTESDDAAVGEIVSEGYRFIAEPDGLTDEELERLLDERCSGGYVALVRGRYDCFVAEAAGAVGADQKRVRDPFSSPGSNTKPVR